jgi:hypothetical protein
MSHAEQAALFQGSNSRQCVAYRITKDTVQVRTGTWLFLQRLLGRWRSVVAVLAVLLPFSFSSCATTKAARPEQTKAAPHCVHERELPDDMAKGGILFERPLWRRILFFWE